MDMREPAEGVSMFSAEEESQLQNLSTLDSVDREILTLLILHPKWSNEEIGEKVGLNRVQVWRRKKKGPLAAVLLEFQKEAISSAAELVINESHDAVRRLGQLAKGICDCSTIIREQSDNHASICLNRVPYAVQMAAAAKLLDILRQRKPEDDEPEEEIWEATITEVGSINTQKQVQGNIIDVTPIGAK
jgi:hypothetical protein